MKQALATAQAPAAIGPYSQGIAAGQTVYVSGQLPIDPPPGPSPRHRGPDRTVPQEHPGHSGTAGDDTGQCGQNYGVSGGHQRFCRDEQGVRRVFCVALPRAQRGAGG